MGFFSFRQEIAMDLGTANTIIISDDKIVVDEPSVVALDRRTDKMIAVGSKAKMMYEKTHDNIRTIRPLRDGVIADFSACEQMMRGLIKMVHSGSRLFTPSLRMVIDLALSESCLCAVSVEDVEEHLVLSLARNDHHVVEVLCAGADERDAAYVDLFDDVGLRSAACYGLLERIEVNDNEVDFRDGTQNSKLKIQNCDCKSQ